VRSVLVKELGKVFEDTKRLTASMLDVIVKDNDFSTEQQLTQ